MPKTFSIGNDFNDLISQELPNQFLIKTTHSKDSTWKITNQETISEKLKEEINSSIQASMVTMHLNQTS